MASAFGRPKDDDEIVIDDFDQVDDNPWYVPKGLHAATVTLCEKGTTKDGDPKTVFTFTIAKGEAKGKDLKVHASHKPTALWRLKKILTALGMNTSGKQLKFKGRDLVGKPCILEVEDQEFNGETRSNVKNVKPPVAA